MGNQITKYEIDYVVQATKAVANLDKIEARIDKLDTKVKQSIALLKSVGQDHSGITKFIGALAPLEAQLKATERLATAADKDLKNLGKGTSGVEKMTASLGGMVKELEATTIALAAATAALVAANAAGGVGGGSPRGGRGRTKNRTGAGGGGAGGAAGFGAAAMGGGTAMAAYAAFRVAHAGIQRIGQAGSDRRTFFEDAANVASAYRDDLQELAVLHGKTTVDDQEIKDDLEFQRKTRLDLDESRVYRLEFGGAVSAALNSKDSAGNSNITPDVAKQLELEAGKFTARYKLDPTTGGRMAGLLGVTQKVPTAQVGLGIMAETMEQLNVQGVGSVKSLAGQMANLSGEMLEEGGGRFKSYPEMAARFAASTVNTFGKADVAKRRIVQSDRLLRKFNGKDEEVFLRNAGITLEDDYETAIRKIAPLIAGPKGDHVLVQAGFGNSTERAAVIAEAKMNGVVDQAIANPRMAQVRAQAMAENAKYAQSPQGQEQLAKTEEFAATVETGQKADALRTARVTARAKMIREGTLKPKSTDIATLTGDAIRDASTFGGTSAEDIRVDTEAIEALRQEGKKVGVDIDQQYPGLSTNGRIMSMQDDEALQTEYGKASSAIEKLKQAAGLLNGAANDMKRDQQKAGGGGAAGSPGNGGAGFNPGRP